MGEFMFSGCICCHTACDFDKILLLCKGEGTCICIEEKCCIAANEDQFPIGLIKEDKMIIKCGLPCCTCGLKVPDAANLISSAFQCLCLKTTAQLPFGDKIGSPVCAICFLQLLPAVQFLKPPPGGGAPPSTPAAEEMQR